MGVMLCGVVLVLLHCGVVPVHFGVGVVLVHCGVGGGWGGAGMRTCNSRLLLMGRVGADKAQGFYSTSYPLVCPQVSQDNFVWIRIQKEVCSHKKYHQSWR